MTSNNNSVGGSGGYEGGSANENGHPWWLSSSPSMTNVRSLGPPPFLTKTYNLVNDPETNSIISWSSLGTSFIIWDEMRLTSELLPIHFRHSNFSSFIYQLNNYRFRKIGLQYRWEYENPYFQAGKEYLLANISRRVKKSRTNNQIDHRVDPNNLDSHVMPLRNLRNEMNETKLEIQNLKQHQKEMENRVLAFKEHVEGSLEGVQDLIKFLAKACNESSFSQLLQQVRDGELNGTKKARLSGPEITETSVHEAGNGDDEDANVKKQGEDEETNIVNEEKDNLGVSELCKENHAEPCTLLEKLMEEVEDGCKNGAGGVESNKQAHVAVELEELIRKHIDQDS